MRSSDLDALNFAEKREQKNQCTDYFRPDISPVKLAGNTSEDFFFISSLRDVFFWILCLFCRIFTYSAWECSKEQIWFYSGQVREHIALIYHCQIDSVDNR